jgi:hypothetical protein
LVPRSIAVAIAEKYSANVEVALKVSHGKRQEAFGASG